MNAENTAQGHGRRVARGWIAASLALFLGVAPNVHAVERQFELGAPHVIRSPGGEFRVLMDFPGIATLGPEWVSAARLEIGFPGLAPTAESELALFEVDRPWSGATWTSPWRTPGGDLAEWDVVTVPLSPRRVVERVRFDVTDAVRSALADPMSSHGFLMTLQSPGRVGFVSGELGSLGSLEANLHITYRKFSTRGITDGGRAMAARKRQARVEDERSTSKTSSARESAPDSHGT